MIEGEKDSVRIELQGARKDLNDKFGGKVMPQNREKAFKKKLVHISDEQAPLPKDRRPFPRSRSSACTGPGPWQGIPSAPAAWLCP